MTPEEFKVKYTGGLIDASIPEGVKEFESKKNNRPTKVDWRGQGIITDEIQNQLGCGACWAFAAVGPAEAAYNAKFTPAEPRKLSEQNLLDCAATSQKSCETGETMLTPFEYMQNTGITNLSNYPYVAVQGTCDTTRVIDPLQISSFSWVGPGNSALQNAISNSVVSLGIPINVAWMSYSEGVFNDPDCASGAAGGHAIIIVGYNTEAAEPYYLVKNSWGADWGEEGYIRMAILNNRSGVCGMTSWNGAARTTASLD